ncbi:MAG: M28 family peptidase [Oscillospiraceae bacterium]
MISEKNKKIYKFKGGNAGTGTEAFEYSEISDSDEWYEPDSPDGHTAIKTRRAEIAEIEIKSQDETAKKRHALKETKRRGGEFTIDSTMLVNNAGVLEGKTKSVSASHKAAAAICCVLMFAIVVGGPIGYAKYRDYRREHKQYVSLPPELEKLSAGYLTAVLPDIAVPLDTHVSEDRLKTSMEMLINTIGNRFVGTDGNARARSYITEQLTEMGYLAENGTMYAQPFTIDIEATREVERPKPPKKTGTGIRDKKVKIEYVTVIEKYHVFYDTENVIAVKPTAAPNPKIVVVSAHVDSVYNTRGAIDNGSGVAALLELARVIGESRRDYGVEIHFCFFSGEELGMHGAYHYLKQLSADERARHAAMLNIDMAACSVSSIPKAFSVSTYGKNTTSGYTDGTFAEPANNIVSSSAIRAYEKNEFGIPRLFAPIHWEKNDLRPFHKAGIDAATVSWREIDKTRAITNYDIASPIVMHTPDDVLETMDMNSLCQTTRFTAKAFEELCKTLRGESANMLGAL